MAERGRGQISPDSSLGAQSSTLTPDTINGISSARPQSSIPNKVVPAVGWAFNDKGEVVLTAEETFGRGIFRQWRDRTSCQAH